MVEAIALAAVLMGILTVVVVTDLPILFLLFPVLGWAAWRFLQPGAAPAALLTSLFATWAAVEGRSFLRGANALRPDAHAPGVQRVRGVYVALLRGGRERAGPRRAAGFEAAAAALEERVRQRTTEVTTANER